MAKKTKKVGGKKKSTFGRGKTKTKAKKAKK